MHELAPTQLERTLRTRCHIGDHDVRHPLQRKLIVFRDALAQADHRRALVVHQVLKPKRALPRGEHAREEAHLALVLGDGNVGT